MNSKEKLMNGVLSGNLSVIDNILAEHFYSADIKVEVLRAAKIKFHEAKMKALEAESIIDLLEVGQAANDSMLNDDWVVNPAYESAAEKKLINSLADKNDAAAKILVEISKMNARYLNDLDRLGARGDEIVELYKFSDKSLFNLFNFLDNGLATLIRHLAEYNEKGIKK